MRGDLIHGIIGVVLGALFTINGLLSARSQQGSAAYQSGKLAAAALGVAFLASGLYYVRKASRDRSRQNG